MGNTQIMVIYKCCGDVIEETTETEENELTESKPLFDNLPDGITIDSDSFKTLLCK